MTFDPTNSGILTRNKRKEKETHPTHQGSINVDGKEFWLSAWVKEGRDGTKLAGEKYFSLSIKPKDEQGKPAAKEKVPAASQGQSFEDDDIPF